jgi:hypothetical protein
MPWKSCSYESKSAVGDWSIVASGAGCVFRECASRAGADGGVQGKAKVGVTIEAVHVGMSGCGSQRCTQVQEYNPLGAK